MTHWQKTSIGVSVYSVDFEVFLLKSCGDELRYSIYRVKEDSSVMVFGSFRKVVGVLLSNFMPEGCFSLPG